MSKYRFQQSDIYQPGTDLPINRLNIGDAEILHEIETHLLQQAYQTFVFELTADTRFDEAYFQSLHQRIFSELEKEDFLRGAARWPRERFADRLAYYQSELIALHPFYELNGRITRLFFDLVAIHNGYAPIDYGQGLRDDPEVDNNYIRASIDCVQRADHALLRELVYAGLISSEAES